MVAFANGRRAKIGSGEEIGFYECGDCIVLAKSASHSNLPRDHNQASHTKSLRFGSQARQATELLVLLNEASSVHPLTAAAAPIIRNRMFSAKPAVTIQNGIFASW